ncbi:MAG: hypothetical protein EOO39_10940 [Cytophagaceae bacterium]|nr:MAG: hypothetical protein EOO39_10940 [Cytophagaceae bacterium]
MRSLFTSMLLLSVLIVWCFTGFAQSRVTGRMLDSTTGQPVPFVSVALYRIADTVAVIGGITDSTGRYLK